MNSRPEGLKRPGGFLITERAITICGFQKGARIIDIGCGSGASCKYLTDNYGLDVSGIDRDLATELSSAKMIRASSEQIPFCDNYADGIFMECSFSLMENQAAVLSECSCALKEKGKLIISDMYAHGEAAQFSGCLGKIETRENIISLLEDNFFSIEHFEDFTHLLKTMWGQMILDKGAESFYCGLGVNPEIFKRVKCGYYLLIASKSESKF